jgi:hypothetical protein
VQPPRKIELRTTRMMNFIVSPLELLII